MPTDFLTSLEVDEPIVLDAEYRFGHPDRQYIDDQIRAIQQVLIDGLIKKGLGTFHTLDAGSAVVAPGKAVCLASTAAGTVTLATAATLANAKLALGVVVKGGNPGSRIFVAFGGILPPIMTGLAAGSPGAVRVNTTTGALEFVGSPSSGDFLIGTVDNAGWLVITPGASAGGGGGGPDVDPPDDDTPPPSVAITETHVIDWSLGNVFRKNLALGSTTFTFANDNDGMTIVVRLTGSGSSVTWPAGIKWAGGVPPTQTSSGTDVYTFIEDDTAIYGSVVQALA